MENTQNILDNQAEYCIAENTIDPLADGISSVELIRVSGSDLDIVNAARVSYGKVSTQVSERDKTLISFLMELPSTREYKAHHKLSLPLHPPRWVRQCLLPLSNH